MTVPPTHSDGRSKASQPAWPFPVLVGSANALMPVLTERQRIELAVPAYLLYALTGAPDVFVPADPDHVARAEADVAELRGSPLAATFERSAGPLGSAICSICRCAPRERPLGSATKRPAPRPGRLRPLPAPWFRPIEVRDRPRHEAQGALISPFPTGQPARNAYRRCRQLILAPLAKRCDDKVRA
jgi:hypothetical protein